MQQVVLMVRVIGKLIIYRGIGRRREPTRETSFFQPSEGAG
jgi:hypothetical protein